MTSQKTKLRRCSKGHQYYKSSDCPTCPICEGERRPKEGFLSILSAPARRAIESNGISTLEELSKYTEEELLKFHGLGKASLPLLRTALNQEDLSFRSVGKGN